MLARCIAVLTLALGARRAAGAPLTDAALRTAVADYFASPWPHHAPQWGAIETWDTSQVTDMSGLFYNRERFNADISAWNVSRVATMHKMFFSMSETGTSFNQPIGRWDTGSVEDMSFMFSSAQRFNQPLGNWDVSQVTARGCGARSRRCSCRGRRPRPHACAPCFALFEIVCVFGVSLLTKSERAGHHHGGHVWLCHGFQPSRHFSMERRPGRQHAVDVLPDAEPHRLCQNSHCSLVGLQRRLHPGVRLVGKPPLIVRRGRGLHGVGAVPASETAPSEPVAAPEPASAPSKPAPSEPSATSEPASAPSEPAPGRTSSTTRGRRRRLLLLRLA